MSTHNDDDDEIALPADTLSLLQGFLKEKAAAEERFEALKQNAHTEADAAAERRRIEVNMDDFTEDWQLSQFWYSPETAYHLATHAVAATKRGGRVGFVSSPTAFVELMKHSELSERVDPFVFEFDRRFGLFGSRFVFFDFNTPTDFPAELQGSFDTLVVDPPFLSDECWTKTSESVRWLSSAGCKVIVCTGLVMRVKIERELGCKLTVFEPRHKGGLSNEFGCFTNFESEGFQWASDA
ncbi:putative N6-adenine methyltransferase-domain-containing protein [Chytriomyces sp. MP71]|nr:putative N6-adenine methyltransferase-domain-containing protein [Chytriomyces sp. MP71]